MATTIKMCNMSKAIAARVFKMLNEHDVQLKEDGSMGTVIITDIEPKDLFYNEISNILIFGHLIQSMMITRLAYILTRNKYGYEVYNDDCTLKT